MTVKLNLNPLIEHFNDKNPTIASQLNALTKQAEHAEESAFLQATDLKGLIDGLSKKSTFEEIEKTKIALATTIRDSSQFSKKDKQRHLNQLLKLNKPADLQFFFYNYILAHKGEKAIASAQLQLQKLAEALVEIADELDQTDPEMAKEADLLLQDLYKQAASGCKMMGVPGHMHSDECFQEMMPAMDRFESGMEEIPMVVSLEDLDRDPEIMEVAEPEPEFDEVSLDDLDGRLDSMKWRVADRSRKEILEKAKEHALKAKQYYEAYKRYRDKTHSIFDEAGEALRLKSFE